MDCRIANIDAAERELPAATDAQLKEPTFQELWMDLQMEDNKLMQQHPHVK